jgi:hypothetical protein
MLLLEQGSVALLDEGQQHLTEKISLTAEESRREVRDLVHGESLQNVSEHVAQECNAPSCPILLSLKTGIEHGKNLGCHTVLLCRMVVPMFIYSKFSLLSCTILQLLAAAVRLRGKQRIGGGQEPSQNRRF